MSPTAHNGSVLILTLWIIALLSVLLLGLTNRVRLGVRVSDRTSRELWARETLLGAQSLFLQRFTSDPDTEVDSPKDEWVQSLWLDELTFGAQFPESVLPPSFQLTVIPVDEFGKINVNFASKELLVEILKTAGAGTDSEAIASAIIDWRDTDDEGSYEAGTYQGKTPPYLPSNKDLVQIEELLQVEGVSPALFFGEDANHNLQLDTGEDDGDVTWPSDNADGQLQLGLMDLLTVYGPTDGGVVLNANTVSEGVLQAALHIAMEDEDEGNRLASEVVKHRSGKSGVPISEGFVPYTKEEELIAVLSADALAVLQSQDIQIVYHSEAVRFYASMLLTEEHEYVEAEAVAVREEDTTKLKEWHE